jgi:acetyl esterase
MAVNLHPQAKAIIEMMAALGGPVIHESTPEEFRAYYDSRQAPPTEDVHEIRDLSAGGVPSRLYRPSAAKDLGLLVYYHGGGWVIGGLDSHDAVCRSLANKSGHAVLSVDYRLAPEHRYPAAVEDSLCALRWASENASELGIDPERIAVGGDSAGGNLAAVVAQQRPVPVRFQLLIYPATDMTQSHASHRENAAGPVLTEQAMAWFIGHYVPDVSQHREELASPLFSPDALFRDLPPALIITAQYDPLRDEGEAYGARMVENGSQASIVRFNGQFHSFFGMHQLMDDAESAHLIAANALRKALG